MFAVSKVSQGSSRQETFGHRLVVENVCIKHACMCAPNEFKLNERTPF